MGFLYPRTVSVRRQNPIAGVGSVPYFGETPANESNVAKGQNLPATIQFKKARGAHREGLPADAPGRTEWRIMIRASAAPLGLIAERDIIVDDLGKRYVVIAAYWNSLGYALDTELLQT